MVRPELDDPPTVALHHRRAPGIGLPLIGMMLAVDFDVIEKGAAAGWPKGMEWYGAFGLLTTLVWLYLELLRLLAKLQRD